jgi:hypothetical protein
MSGRQIIRSTTLGIALIYALTGRAAAQVPGAPSPGIRMEDPRITAMRNRIRAGATSLKREDIAKLVQPTATKTPPSPTKPTSQPQPPAPHNPIIPKSPTPSPKKPEDPTSVGQSNGSNQIMVGQARVDKPAAEDPKPAAPASTQANSKTTDAKHEAQSDARHASLPEVRSPGLPAGYHPVVQVQAGGRLDWTVVVSRQSLDPAPALQTAGYRSTAQSYELYIPPNRKANQPLGMILHIGCGQKADGWMYFQKICEKHGIVLAGVHGAGNAIADPWRARIVLDVLDDVRRRLPIDPDRTYITGGSGAGHEAGSIAHALPELFGGVVGMCGVWNLRVEQMLRQRMRERISEAVVTGAADFNGPELRFEFFPILQIQSIRSRLWDYPDMGHAVPNAARLEQVFDWLEAGLPQRRMMGAMFPASRLTHALSPQEWATAVLLEAGQRIELPGGLLTGLFELQSVVDRWQGTPAADIAQQLLKEFDGTSAVSSQEIFRIERLEFRYLQSKQFDGTLNRKPPPGYPVPRINLVLIGISLWQEVHDLATTEASIKQEAATRLAALHREAGQ